MGAGLRGVALQIEAIYLVKTKRREEEDEMEEWREEEGGKKEWGGGRSEWSKAGERGREKGGGVGGA